MELWHVIFWAAVTVVAVTVELLTPQLVSIWFGLGGLAAFIMAFFGVPFYVQVIVFTAFSVVLLFATRKMAKKILSGDKEKTNADALIGVKCVVKQKVDNIAGTGRASVSGLEWSARSASDDVTFEIGEICTIDSIKGVTLIIEKAD